MPHYEKDGIRLHYVVGPKGMSNTNELTAVFVHGAGSSHEAWTLQLEVLGIRYQTVALDLSGHGQSSPGPEVTSIEDGYTEELVALVHHLKLQNFVLIGHSMGGGVVMSYALRNDLPQPKALALVDTSYDLNLSHLAVGMTLETLDTYLALLRDRIKGVNQRAIEIIAREEALKMRNPHIMQRDLAAANGFSIAERVHEIDVPTLVIVGEHDSIITPSTARELKNGLPRADFAIIRHADHVPMLQNSSEFNRVLGKFLSWVENNL